MKFPLDDADVPEDAVVAPFFVRISKSLLNCGQNVEFLSTELNKMQFVASEILKDGNENFNWSTCSCESILNL